MQLTASCEYYSLSRIRGVDMTVGPLRRKSCFPVLKGLVEFFCSVMQKHELCAQPETESIHTHIKVATLILFVKALIPFHES